MAFLPERGFAADGPRLQTVDGREVIVLSSGGAFTGNGGFSAQSYETQSQRIHIVSFEGRTFRAATPLEGPWSLIVFDTSRRKFVSLLPSIRVELGEGVDPNAVAKALGAVDVTVFESLGFAIFDLPDGLHPADAVERAENLNGQPRAAMRLRPPRIQWR